MGQRRSEKFFPMPVRWFFLAAALFGAALPARAQTGAFALGQIETVTVTQESPAVNVSTLDNETAYTFNLPSLDRALDILPGVAASNSGGSRNEQLLFVRGFDRFQTPLTIDGIRVYLPADNRLDFARFLTADLAQVQVAKGYVSVLNGPGALGGAINLVTRKPERAWEADARAGLAIGNSGSAIQQQAALSLGTRQDRFYLAASAAWNFQPRFELPNGFAVTPAENGGFRDHSRSEDWSLNLKAGYTPREGDEYSLNYRLQKGSKQAPFSVSDTLASQRDWTWPYWDISSLYFLSQTGLGDGAYLKTRAYYNTFANALLAFDNAAFNTQSLAKSFRSYYDDYAAGASAEAGFAPFAGDVLKAAFFFRRDSHDEFQTVYTPRTFDEPHQLTVEDTYSLAVENSLALSRDLSLVTGLSYDWRHPSKAQDFVTPTTLTGTGTFIDYPLSDGEALNGQAALLWHASDSASYSLNFSDRSRFPTIFERFSTRFNTAASNPSLRAERAATVELSTQQAWDGVKLAGALFYSDVSEVIAAVILPAPAPTGTTQSQNVGHGSFYGLEASLTGTLRADLTAGANYTYLIRHLETPGTQPMPLTGVPGHNAFAWLAWNASPDFTVTPNLELASNRWTVTTNGATYYKTGAFGLLGVSFNWHFADGLDLNFGARNLMDSGYELTAGFPEPGRSVFAQLRFRQ